MGLFEPEIVLHAIDHVRANDEGYFCWCVLQERIDQWHITQRMWVEGHNTLDEFWTAHYGKHDPFTLGIKAIRYGVTVYEAHNGEVTIPLYGRHRKCEDCPFERPCYPRRTECVRPVPDVVAGSRATH